MSARAARGSLAVAIQRAVEVPGTPSDAQLRAWARRAFSLARRGELTIRIVSRAESAELNLRYRRKRGPTNVLSFPAGGADIPGAELLPLGDLVICAEVVAAEAATHGNTVKAHWAHMVVHGALHLQGYDHENAADAGIMEALESKLLKELGFPDPWLASGRAGLQDTK